MTALFLSELKVSSPRVFLDYPYILGGHLLKSAVSGHVQIPLSENILQDNNKASYNKISLRERTFSLVSAVLLFIPIINIIHFIAIKIIFFTIKTAKKEPLEQPEEAIAILNEDKVVQASSNTQRDHLEEDKEIAKILEQHGNIFDFVQNYNKLPIESIGVEGIYFKSAMAILDRIERNIFDPSHGIKSSNRISCLRIKLFNMSRCIDYDIRVRCYKLLLKAFENDPMKDESAHDLVDLINCLAEDLDYDKFIAKESKYLQRQIIKVFEASIECLLLHVSSGHFIKLDQVTRGKYLAKVHVLKNAKLDDFQINFSIKYIEKALSFLEVKEGGLLSIVKVAKRILEVGKLVMEVGLALSGAGDPISAISNSLDEIVRICGDMKELFNNLKEDSEWFEKLLVLKKMCYFSQHESGLFDDTIEVIQNYKIAEEGSLFFEGIISVLESVALNSSVRCIQEDNMKFILQYSFSNHKNVRRRVISTFINIFNEGGIKGSTAYVILHALNSIKMDIDYSEEEVNEVLARNPKQELAEIISSNKNYYECKDYLYLSVIEFLIRWLAQIKDEKDFGGFSLINLLALSKEYSVIKGLLKFISNIFPNYNEPDVYGFTPYMIAVMNNNLPMIQCINEVLDIDINAKDIEKGYTILHMIVNLYKDHPAVAREMLAYISKSDKFIKFNYNNVDKNGDTALNLAVKYSYIELVKDLLNITGQCNVDTEIDFKYKNIDVDIANHDGYKPLEIAIKNKNIELVKLLMNRGSTSNTVSSKQYKEAVILASYLRSEVVLKELIGAQKNKFSRLEAIYILDMIGCFKGDIKCSINFADFHLNQLENNSVYRETFQFYQGHRLERIGMAYRIVGSGHVFGVSEKLLAFTSKESDRILESVAQLDVTEKDCYGFTPLHFAVMMGDLEAIEILINNGADCNAPNTEGFTPLHLASLWKNIKAFKLLLKNRGNINLVNDYGDTPLAQFCGNIDNRTYMLEYFLKLGYLNIDTFSVNYVGVDFNEWFDLFEEYSADFYCKDVCGNNILHHAACAGSPALIESLITRLGINIFWERNNQNLIPLQSSCLNLTKNKSIIKRMVEVEARKCRTKLSNDVVCDDGWIKLSALFKYHDMCWDRFGLSGSLANFLAHLDFNDLFEALYKEDNSILDKHDSTYYWHYPLHAAVINNSEKLVKTYIKNGWDLNYGDSFGNRAVMLALLKRNMDVALILIESGMIDVDATNYDNRTALHISAAKGELEAIKALINAGANVKARDVYGNTPFHMACIYGRKETVNFLLSTYPDSLEMENDDRSPIHSICVRGHYTILESLISFSREGRVNRINFNIEDVFGRTPIMLAAQEGHKGLVDLLAPMSDLECLDRNGENVLHKAIFNRHYEIVKTILEVAEQSASTDLKTIINQKDSDGEVPLHELAKLGNEKSFDAINILNILHEYNIDLRALDGSGSDFLHKMSYFGCTELMRQYFNINCREKRKVHYTRLAHERLDNEGRSYLSIAASRGHKSTCEYLVSIGADRKHKNHKGQTPFLEAILNGHYDLATAILLKPRVAIFKESVASDITISDKDGRNIAHYIMSKKLIEQRDIELLKRLIGGVNNKALLHTADKTGRTALHYLAMCSCDERALDYIVKNFPLNNKGFLQINMSKDKDGHNALAIAEDRGMYKFADKLRHYCFSRQPLEDANEMVIIK